jgi:hypothetical protein
MQILILEDDKRRRSAMLDCVRDRFHQYETVFFDDARKMCAHLQAKLGDALIISLDHDLELRTGDNGKLVDMGSGREVAEFLATQSPCCPVVIATTNSAAGDAMEMSLREARWETHRVFPHGDLEWISSQWFRTLRNAIVGSARPRQTSN